MSNITFNIIPPSGPASNISNIRVSGIVSTIINILLGGAGIISFIYLLWGGWAWIMSGGDKDALERARKRVTTSLVGLAIVFSSYALLYLLRSFFGVNLIQLQLNAIGS
jgi:hypothetical protein